MDFWKRLLITFIAMLVISYVAGFACTSWFGFVLPSYAAGVIGGLTALPVWEFLKPNRLKGGVT